MRSRMRIVSGLVLVPLLVAQAQGQWKVIVGPQRQVNPEGQGWRECSVSARLADGNEAVAAATVAYPGSGLAYAGRASRPTRSRKWAWIRE